MFDFVLKKEIIPHIKEVDLSKKFRKVQEEDGTLCP